MEKLWICQETTDVGDLGSYLGQTVIDNGEVAYVGEVSAELEDSVGHFSVGLGL